VTPAKETWNDQFIPWQNRVEFQWPGSLVVPPLPMFSDCCPSSECHSSPAISATAATHTASISSIKAQPTRDASNSKKHVPVPSKRCKLTVRTSHQRRCKAAFYDACKVAITFRKRYDASPDLFSTIEKPFMWSDPAEPVLLESSRLLGTTIIDSHCPFRVPHIIINAPPPPHPWISLNNATSDPQDHGYGQFLTVPSLSVSVINAPAEGWEDDISSDSSSLIMDLSESISRPSTPLPETPIDDNLEFFFSQPGEDIGDDMTNGFFQLIPVPSMICAEGPPRPPRPIFTIEEDEDDLPPFDDWYMK